MDIFFTLVIVFLLINIVLALFRLWRGSGIADRLLSTQLFGTVGMAILMILTAKQKELTLLNVVITFNVLSILIVICLVQVWKKKKEGTS